MNPLLHSLRLDFRPCADTDTELLLNHWTEPMVRRYLFDNKITDRETVEGFIASSCASFEKNSYGLWVLTNKTNGEFQGVCGLWDGTLDNPELLFSIATSCWKQGLATESTQRVLEYAFGELLLSKVMATVDKPNTESVRVLEKLGMQLVKEELLNGHPLLYYELNSRKFYGE